MWSLWPNIRFLPSIVAEKNVTKNSLEGRTDRGKTVYPPRPSGNGVIIRSKIGSKCVDLIFIRLAKCWNNLFLQNFVYDYTVKMSSRNIYFFSFPAKCFLQDSESKYFFRKNNIKLKLNSLRGKLIKKNCKTKMVLPYTNKKRNKNCGHKKVPRENHSFQNKTFFHFSKLNLCKLFHL